MHALIGDGDELFLYSEAVLMKGDIIAVTATDADGQKYVIVSFHGDTNGLATIPVLAAVHKTMAESGAYGDHELIFGLDANTYETVGPKKDKQDVGEFGQYFVSLRYSSCWGDVPDRTNYSTFNARTYLHARPEIKYELKQTSEFVKKTLKKLDVKFTGGWAKTTKDSIGYGVVAEIGKGSSCV